MLITAPTVHGGWPAKCQHRSGTSVTQADTTRLPIPTALNLPQDSVLTVAPPGAPDVLYYRNIVGIAFVENASGRAVRAVLRKYHAVIIGGDPYAGPWGGYIVRIPDPGPSMDALGLLLSRIEAEAAVAEASWVTYRDKFVPRTSVQQPCDALEIVSFIPWSSLPESNSGSAGTTRPAMPRHPE